MAHKKMDPEAKAKWVAALRSGKYKQTQLALYRPVPGRYPAGYCCLGVLNEVCDLGQDPRDTTLSPDRMARVRLSYRATGFLIAKNDDSRWDFGLIADWIEKNL